jgi:hypothetical protein
MKKHDKFIAKYDLKIPLASDEDGAISDAFGTWVEKSMYGRKYMGMEPAGESRALVASLCGYPDWPALLAATGEARQRIAARWAAVREIGKLSAMATRLRH